MVQVNPRLRRLAQVDRLLNTLTLAVRQRLRTTPVDQLRLPTTPAGRRRQRMGPRTRHHVLPHLRSTPRLTHRIQQIEIQPQRLALTMLLTPLCMNA